MDGITYDKIRVQGGPKLKGIENLEIYTAPNEHGRATVTGFIDDEETLNDWLQAMDNPEVSILFAGESGSEGALFSGYLKDAELSDQSGFKRIRLELVSGTILLDRTRACKSYQDGAMTYSEVVRTVLKNNQGSDCICTIGENVRSEKPLIQYLETNWQFIRRLASHLGAVIYPEIRQSRPRFWFGFPEQVEVKVLTVDKYIAGFSERYYELGGSFSGYQNEDFVYYEVETIEDFELDTAILFRKRQWRIGWKSARLVNGLVIFRYVLCQPPLVTQKKMYNSLFCGRSILGEVLAVENETVRLHLEIDETQELAKAYCYEWAPDTGSAMYCMPKVGATVSLYFSSEDEQEARAVSGVWTGDSDFLGMLNPNQRGLTTEHGKKLFLNLESLGLEGMKAGNSLKLEDEVAVALESSKKISIYTGGTARFKGKTVVMETPVEISLVRR